MNKTLLAALVGAIVLAVGVTAWRMSVAGPQALGAPSPYVKAEAGKALVEFAKTAPVNTAAAKRALESVRLQDPQNGYPDILAATLMAQEGNTAEAIRLLQAGARAENMTHFILEEPAHENMPTLSRLRQLASHGRTLKADSPDAELYFESMRAAGIRVAKMEPVTSLGVSAGVSMIRQANGIAADLFAKGDEVRAARWRERATSFEAWAETFKQKAGEINNDVIRDAGREAGLTDQEIKDLALGAPLPEEKQRRVDAAFAGMVEKERKALIALVETMPKD